MTTLLRGRLLSFKRAPQACTLLFGRDVGFANRGPVGADFAFESSDPAMSVPAGYIVIIQNVHTPVASNDFAPFALASAKRA